MNICKRLDTSFNRSLQPFERVGVSELDSSEHTRKQVLASMLGLPSQGGDLLLTSLLLGDVSRDLRRANDLSVGVPDGGHGQRNDNQTAIFALPNRLEMVGTLPSPDPRQNRSFFVMSVYWNHDRDGLANRLFRRVAEDTFGTPVPACDHAIEVFAHDRVIAKQTPSA